MIVFSVTTASKLTQTLYTNLFFKLYQLTPAQLRSLLTGGFGYFNDGDDGDDARMQDVIDADDADEGNNRVRRGSGRRRSFRGIGSDQHNSNGDVLARHFDFSGAEETNRNESEANLHNNTTSNSSNSSNSRHRRPRAQSSPERRRRSSDNNHNVPGFSLSRENVHSTTNTTGTFKIEI